MEPTWLTALAGGLCIGLAASILWLFNGRIAGISGILGGLLTPGPDLAGWRLAFLGGLLGGGLALGLFAPEVFGAPPGVSTPWILVAGIVVGFGTRTGNGCTSGHGVCGLPRGSTRSIVATVTFMATAALTVWVTRHVLGGGA